MIQEKVFKLAEKLLSDPVPLKEWISCDNHKLTPVNPEIKHKNPGVYAFWLNSHDSFNADQLNKRIELAGPADQKEPSVVHWQNNRPDSKSALLYIGKTTTIQSRLSQHLKLRTTDFFNIGKKQAYPGKSLHKPTTSCQVRSGIEHLFWGHEMNFSEVLPFISFNFIPIADIRFFVEDLAIGLGCPWFNVDSER